MVECHLAKVKVAGPNPVSRSIEKTHPITGWIFSMERETGAHTLA